MKTVMSKGTMADKVAAQILQVQNSPVHSLSTLGSLIGMVKVGKKKECLQVMENLVELWTKDLLRPNMKLTPFEMRPFESLDELDKSLRDKCLLLWWFEAKLKDLYVTFIRALDAISKESIENIKVIFPL
jgi:ribosome biogenesis protein MAK21